MNKPTSHIIYIPILLILLIIGCKKDEPQEIDPTKIILGKWEITHMGNYPNLEPVENPLGYREYLPDSINRVYSYETNDYEYRKYWMDSLLHIGIEVDDKFALKFEYRYRFIENNNQLHLTYTNIIAINNDFIYKRIK